MTSTLSFAVSLSRVYSVRGALIGQGIESLPAPNDFATTDVHLGVSRIFIDS